jgi:hypothetical protein
MQRIRNALSGPMSRITDVVYSLDFVTAMLGAVLTPGTPNDIAKHEGLFRCPPSSP